MLFPYCNNSDTDDYIEALKQGAFPAAHIRLMFLGEGGSGKSSLLNGLMNNPFKDTNSTALADTRSVSHQWMETAHAASDAWRSHGKEDQVMVLAAQTSQVVEGKKQLEQTSEVKHFDAQEKSLTLQKKELSDANYAEAAQIQSTVFDEIIGQALSWPTNKNADVVMNIWDCGGQPVFLDIVPAFLTSRTMFLLLFNASLDLDNVYKEIWRHNGKSIQERKQNITRRQLMMQWMQLIHTMYQKSKGSSMSVSLPTHPKAMIIGTHGDKIKSERANAVLNSLKSTCNDAAFSELVVDMMVVDNTTSGMGKLEDPGYKRIREKIEKFAQSFMVPTPLAWGAFRIAMQKTTPKSPILTYDKSCTIAEQCGIPKDKVPSVLHFYHELGAMLHYSTIPSLNDTVITEPKWLVKQLQKLLMPDQYHKRPADQCRMWEWLKKRGVLVEQLYQEVWWDCGLKNGAQSLADLLEHFDLAKKINQCPRDMQQYKGNKYFMPCMLNARPKSSKGVQSQNMSVQLCQAVRKAIMQLYKGIKYFLPGVLKAKPKSSKCVDLEAVRKASTLHVVFKMDYVPPGFFVRIVAQMTGNKQYMPLLDKVVYRDSITFQYNVIDRVTIVESLHSIEFKVCRVSKRTPSYNRFAESCVSLRTELFKMCNEVILQWLPSVEFDFAFKCTCSKHTKHFAILKPDSSQDTTLFCMYDKEYKVSQQDKFWLPLPALMKPHVSIDIEFN